MKRILAALLLLTLAAPAIAQDVRTRAEQGDAVSQYVLGTMFDGGNGVPQDYVQAYEWLNLSAAQEPINATFGRDLVAKKMTPAQIAEAQKLTRDWLAAFDTRTKN